jgi:hypothetical protein
MKEETEEIRRTRVRMIERCVLMDNTFSIRSSEYLFTKAELFISGGRWVVCVDGREQEGW